MLSALVACGSSDPTGSTSEAAGAVVDTTPPAWCSIPSAVDALTFCENIVAQNTAGSPGVQGTGWAPLIGAFACNYSPTTTQPLLDDAGRNEGQDPIVATGTLLPDNCLEWPGVVCCLAE